LKNKKIPTRGGAVASGCYVGAKNGELAAGRTTELGRTRTFVVVTAAAASAAGKVKTYKRTVYKIERYRKYKNKSNEEYGSARA